MTVGRRRRAMLVITVGVGVGVGVGLSAAAAAGNAPASPAAPVTSPAAASALAESVLADGRFAFCHDARYQLTPEEALWCPEIRVSGPPCPTFGQICQPGGRAAIQRGRAPSRGLELPALALPRAVVLAFAAAVLAALLFLLVRGVLRARAGRRGGDGDGDEDREAAVPEVGATAGAAAPTVETDVERLLARARAAAAAGDFGRAVVELHAALLRRLEGAGILDVHPFRTNGDYARQVAAARPPLAASMRGIVADVERAQFGHAPPTSALFDSLLDRVQGMMRATLLLLALALPLAAVPGCDPLRPDWEHSPSGRAAVTELCRRAGVEVHELVTSVAGLEAPREGRALLLLPGASLNTADWARLWRWFATDGGTLIVAGPPAGAPSWLRAKAADGPRRVRGPARPAAGVALQMGRGGLRLPPSPELRLDRADTWGPLLVRDGGALYAAERRDEGDGDGDADRAQGKGGGQGDEDGDEDEDEDEDEDGGRIILLADDWLFTNAALALPENPGALLALVRHAGSGLEIVGELAGLVSTNPVTSVRRGRLAPFLLQLAALLGVFFLWKGVHFGRPRDPEVAIRRDFLEHVEAVGRAYARGRAAGHALRSFSQWLIERLHRRVGLSAGRGVIGLAEALAARTGRPAGTIARVLVEAREGADGGASAAPAPAPTSRRRRPSRHEVEAQLAVYAELCELSSQTGGSPRERR